MKNEADAPLRRNADLIRATLDGATIQFRAAGSDDPWLDSASTETAITLMVSANAYEFRRKPENIVRWVGMGQGAGEKWAMGVPSARRDAAVKSPSFATHVIRLELDPETLATVGAATESV